MTKCRVCGEEKEDSFFFKAAKKDYLDKICKSCKHSYQMQRRKNFKIKIMESKGGKCECCGHTGQPCDFDLHHRDPRTKENQLSGGNLRSWNKILEEIDKCHLLCAICHRRVHFNKDRKWLEV